MTEDCFSDYLETLFPIISSMCMYIDGACLKIYVCIYVITQIVSVLAASEWVVEG